MPKRIPPLSDTKISKAKKRSTAYKLFDGSGLFLLVTPDGSKLWRFRYILSGKEKLLALGKYPEISLLDARQRRMDARALLAKGVDPSASRKAEKVAKTAETKNCFEAIAREWHIHKTPQWAPDHAKTILTRLEKDIFPFLGAVPVSDITAGAIKDVVDRVKSRGTIEAARRILTIVRQVETYAVLTDRNHFIVSQALRGYLPPTSKTRKHMSAVTDPREFSEILRIIDGYQGSFIIQCALKLLPMLFCRPGELRHLEWADVDFESKQIIIPAAKMKMRADHIIPLSRQAVDIISTLQKLTGGCRYLFPSARTLDRCMSDNALNAAYRRMGIDGQTLVAHGFRASARTILHEVLHIDPFVIEAQLAHRVPDALGAAYNRTHHLDERRRMMQRWADFLDSLKAGAKIIQFPTKTGTER